MAQLLSCTRAGVPPYERGGARNYYFIIPNFWCKLYPDSILGGWCSGRRNDKKKSPLPSLPNTLCCRNYMTPAWDSLQCSNYKGETMGILSVKSLPIALHFSSNFKHSVSDMPVPISIYLYPKRYSLKPGTVWKPVKISFSTSDIPATSEAHWGPWTRLYGISSLSTAICGLLHPYVFSITSSNTHYFIDAFYLCLPSLLSEVLWKDYHFNFCKAIISINVIIKPIFFLTEQNINSFNHMNHHLLEAKEEYGLLT